MVNKNYKYVGEFKKGDRNGFGIYYNDDGSYKFTKFNKNTLEAFKFYGTSGEIEFCKYTKIIIYKY